MSIKLIFASTAALALVAGAPAYAKNESARALAAADAAASGVKAKENRTTCRYIDKTAARTKRERLCMTREEWKKFDAEQAL